MSGLLGKALTIGGIQRIATLPGDIEYASVNILIANPTPSPQIVSVFIGTSDIATAVDTIIPGAIIPSKGELEIACRICSPGEKISVDGPSGLVVRVENVAEEG